MARWLCVAIFAAYPYRVGCDIGVPIVPLDAGAPDAGAPDAGAPDAGQPDAAFRDAGTVFHVYFASQTTTQSLLVQLRYDVTDDSVVPVDTFDLTPTVGTDSVRVVLDAPESSGGLLVAGFSSPAQFHRVLLNPMRVSGTLLLSGRPNAELTDITGGCLLPNGNLIASSYGNGLVAEFSGTGTWVRDLGGLASFYMTDCAGSPSGVVTLDNAMSSDGFGFVRQLYVDAGSWVQGNARSLHSTDGGREGAAYVAVPHTNGDLYLPPLSPGPSSEDHVLRCPGASVAACAPVGPSWPVAYPLGAVTGAVQIPGHADLLLIDGRSLYRYRVSNDTLTPLYMPNIADQQWVRMMRIHPL